MTAPSSHMWYVKAAGGVWGPYPEARICTFVAEGRVCADTPVSPWAQGPFAPAAANAEFGGFFHPSPIQFAHQGLDPRRARSVADAGPLALAPAAAAKPAPAAKTVAAGPLRPLLVWAELSAASTTGFHAALADTGSGVTIRPGLWLVQGRVGAAALRNRLSRTLTAADMLLVIEAPLDHAAWFNLDPGRDRDLRRLWGN